jgi:hypothetical protein
LERAVVATAHIVAMLHISSMTMVFTANKPHTPEVI